jgi:hypothetical protein
VRKLTGGIGTIFVGGFATFWLPDLDPDQKVIQKLNIGHHALAADNEHFRTDPETQKSPRSRKKLLFLF